MKTLLCLGTGILVGLLMGFFLFGLQILPHTVWRFSLPGEEPVRLSASMAAPVLVRLPSGTYFYIYEYESHSSGNYWYLYDYREYHNGHWGARNSIWPLTLGISDSYEIFMLPDYYGKEVEKEDS